MIGASAKIFKTMKNVPTWKKLAGLSAGSFATLFFIGNQTAKQSDDILHAGEFDWPNRRWFQSYDYKSLRRGWQVFKEVCAACHGIELIAYRNLIGTILTEEEAKEEAAKVMVQDGPDDKGEMFERSGKLSDYVPNPYANENAARAANSGGLPPDLSVITKARHGGADYLFSLLTGYKKPPAGVEIREGLHYNPYFYGGAISMRQALYNGMVEYEDGTAAPVSQLAKDVVHFLSWASEPEHDVRKLTGIKVMAGLVFMTFATWYHKKWRWSVIKSRKVKFYK